MGSKLDGPIGYWEALMEVTHVSGMEETSAGTNKVEVWHRTLSRTRTLQRTKICIHRCATLTWRPACATSGQRKPTTSEVIDLHVVPAVASTAIEGPKQMVVF